VSEYNSQIQRLESMRDKLIGIDPTFTEYDLDDPQCALAIIVVSAMLKGSSIRIGVETEERTETISIDNVGQAANGIPLVCIKTDSSDGKLSSDTAELAASLIQPQLQAEIESIIGY
jgi:hypothetical protein